MSAIAHELTTSLSAMTSSPMIQDITGLSWETVRAWTETRATRSLVARPVRVEDCVRLLKAARQQGLTLCPRGAGYSYADMILNNGQIVVEMAAFNQILSFDRATGRMVVQPGVVVSKVLSAALRHGWTLPSCTGGMGVSMGGAVSNNVHGKDSWKDGNFGENVVAIELLLPSAEIVTISRHHRPELFKAVIGGMGMLGFILEITLQLKRVPSAFVVARTIPVRNIEESLDVMEGHRDQADFMIAWVDAFAKGKGLGRGTVEVARWLEDAPPVAQEEIDASLVMPKRIFGLVPAKPAWAVGRHFFRPGLMKMANAAKYRLNKWRASDKGRRILFTDYNFMLNKIPGWKCLYRPHGYVELQPLLPRPTALAALKETLRYCQKHGAQSVLCAVKLHQADDYLLSFEGDGYDIGIDVTLKGRSPEFMQRFSRDFYTFVADQGGKVFLAKDELLPPDLFRRMYPRHGEFAALKRQVDPAGSLASDMYRRFFGTA